MAKKPKRSRRRPAGARARRKTAAAKTPEARPAPPPSAEAPGIVIAGVGASAGGLEAFSQLLQALPRQPGLAIVLVQHLAPQHESALAVLLSGRTNLPVEQATEGMPLEPDRVYVIP